MIATTTNHLRADSPQYHFGQEENKEDFLLLSDYSHHLILRSNVVLWPWQTSVGKPVYLSQSFLIGNALRHSCPLGRNLALRLPSDSTTTLHLGFLRGTTIPFSEVHLKIIGHTKKRLSLKPRTTSFLKVLKAVYLAI